MVEYIDQMIKISLCIMLNLIHLCTIKLVEKKVKREKEAKNKEDLMQYLK